MVTDRLVFTPVAALNYVLTQHELFFPIVAAEGECETRANGKRQSRETKNGLIVLAEDVLHACID
jgi:hypothetical protein